TRPAAEVHEDAAYGRRLLSCDRRSRGFSTIGVDQTCTKLWISVGAPAVAGVSRGLAKFSPHLSAAPVARPARPPAKAALATAVRGARGSWPWTRPGRTATCA